MNIWLLQISSHALSEKRTYTLVHISDNIHAREKCMNEWCKSQWLSSKYITDNHFERASTTTDKWLAAMLS